MGGFEPRLAASILKPTSTGKLRRCERVECQKHVLPKFQKAPINIAYEGQSHRAPNRPHPCVILLGFVSRLSVVSERNNSQHENYILVYDHFKLRLSTRPRKLPPSRLNGATLQMSERCEVLSTTIPTQLSINNSAPTNKVLVKNHRRAVFDSIKWQSLWELTEA